MALQHAQKSQQHTVDHPSARQTTPGKDPARKTENRDRFMKTGTDLLKTVKTVKTGTDLFNR
jgi:hypothetical protein